MSPPPHSARPPPQLGSTRVVTLAGDNWMSSTPKDKNNADTSQGGRKELNSRQRANIIWAATPEENREPKTKKELAQVLGVTEQAMWKWARDPRVIEGIRFVTLQNAGGPLKVTAMLDMIYDVALAKRDPKLGEIWLKATGVYSQFGRSGDMLAPAVDENGDSFDDFSLEELEALKAEAEAAKAESVSIALAKKALRPSQGLPGASDGVSE